MYNRFLVHYETSLLCYPLELIVRVSQSPGQANRQLLSSAAERVASGEGSILMFRQVVSDGKLMGEFRSYLFGVAMCINCGGGGGSVLYASKRTLHSPTLNALLPVDLNEMSSPHHRHQRSKSSFKPYGQVCGIVLSFGLYYLVSERANRDL